MRNLTVFTSSLLLLANSAMAQSTGVFELGFSDGFGDGADLLARLEFTVADGALATVADFEIGQIVGFDVDSAILTLTSVTNPDYVITGSLQPGKAVRIGELPGLGVAAFIGESNAATAVDSNVRFDIEDGPAVAEYPLGDNPLDPASLAAFDNLDFVLSFDAQGAFSFVEGEPFPDVQTPSTLTDPLGVTTLRVGFQSTQGQFPGIPHALESISFSSIVNGGDNAPGDPVSEVPIPGALPLLITGIAGLVAIRRRTRA